MENEEAELKFHGGVTVNGPIAPSSRPQAPFSQQFKLVVRFHESRTRP